MFVGVDWIIYIFEYFIVFYLYLLKKKKIRDKYFLFLKCLFYVGKV